MVEIYGITVDNRLDDGSFQQLLSKIDIEKQKRIKRFRKWEDGHRTLIADLLVRYLVVEKLDIPNNEIHFSTSSFNKPLLKSIDHFHFNCAHSGRWVVCAIDNAPVGIDVERKKAVDFDIAKRFFSTEEYDTLMNQGESERSNHFFLLWTLKESYLKAIGKGLYQPLNSFTIRFSQKRQIQLFSGDEIVPDVFLKTYTIDPNYCLSVCGSSKGFADSVSIKEFREIAEVFI